MKNPLRLLVTSAALALLVGCGAASAPPAVSESTPLPPDVSELPPPVPEEIIRYTVTSTTQEDTVQTDDGTVLLSSRFQFPVLTSYREDGTVILQGKTDAEEQALLTAAAFNDKFIDWSASEGIQDVADMAKEDYAWHKQENIEWTGAYTLELDCTAYQTEHMVSVSGLYYSYTGGAHPNTVYLAWNFDLESGAFFAPDALGDGPDFQEAVTAELIRQCQEQAAEYQMEGRELFWPDYETILADWPSYAVSFDHAGMTVSFSAYELASYAAGPQIFEIPYDFLKPYLSEQGLAILDLTE